MARLNPRRRKAKAQQGQGGEVVGNLSSPKARHGKVDAKAPAIEDRTSYLFANATANAPQGAAFTARNPTAPLFMDTTLTDGLVSNLRPIVGFMPRIKRFKRFSAG